MQLSARLVACALLCAAAAGCMRTVQAWPPPLTADNVVTVWFSVPRNIAYEGESGRDSIAGVRELEGRVVSLQGDTLVLRVTRVPRGPAAGSIAGRPATVLLDAATHVSLQEVDGWKIGYAILSSTVLIFAILAMTRG